MDLSVISYLLILPVLLTGIYFIREWNWIKKLEYYYFHFILFIVILLLSANILLYYYWENLLNFRALSYLQDISELSSSFSFFQIFIGLSVIFFLCILLYFLFRKFVFRPLPSIKRRIYLKGFGYLILVSCVIILMRGGLQKLPMNESLISFSSDNFINQAAINPGWHLANDIYRAGLIKGNPFKLFPEDIAEKKVKTLFECSVDSFPRILTTIQPNIVVIILESFTADIVGAMGGEKNISPALDRLISEGVLFNNIYSSGTRTDQGIVSLLNGWPATPYYSIMRSSEKASKLPSLPRLFLEKGYRTSFFYGGKSNFSNMNVYCFNQKFENIFDEESFPSSIPKSSWGIPDEYVFNFQLEELNKSKTPFFSTIMTLSNHEPFDVPGPTRFPGSSDADRFRNSSLYTDATLGQFINKAKEQPWYKNTLFIIVADHGHSLPLYRNVYYPESHRIPFLFFGEVIKPEFRGAVVTKLGDHHDLPGTLLPQLNMMKENSKFKWSKNLLNPTVKPFAYYQIDHLLGWVDTNYWYGYSYNRKKFIARSYNITPTQLERFKIDGQAFVQVLYDDYRRY
jgi:phosphoglycerol transferase MdoB-like AlkP superfamily enzyme